MKIGIIVDKFPSVSETFILNKVEGLCKRGHQVTVFRNSRHNDIKLEKQLLSNDVSNLVLVDMNLPGSFIQATRKILLNPSVAVSAFRSSTISIKKNILTAIRDKYFAAHHCDIYHFEFSGLATTYMPLFKSLLGKIVVSCRGSAEKVKAITQPGRKEELQQLFSKVNYIHCVSEDMATTIQEYGAPAIKIFVNRPAIISNFFTPAIKVNDTSVINIVSIGRLTFQKGFLVGLLAFKEVIKQNKNVHWTIAGDGPLLEEIKFYIHDLQLTDYVTLAGSVAKQQVLNLLQQADIFFLPSVYEGIANVVLEAMAMQLPVVSSNCSGMHEVITNDVNGMLADNYNSTEMANQLLMLINNKSKRIEIGLAARKRIEEAFDLERQLDIFEQQYTLMLTPATA